MKPKRIAVFLFKTPSGQVKVMGQYRTVKRHNGPDFIQEQFMSMGKPGPLLDLGRTTIQYVTTIPALDPHDCERLLSVDEYFTLVKQRKRGST